MSEWIDPNVLTPQLDFDVIVCVDDDVFMATYVGDLKFTSKSHHGYGSVDYWMPLPEPPNA
jgi:hypothetical protein